MDRSLSFRVLESRDTQWRGNMKGNLVSNSSLRIVALVCAFVLALVYGAVIADALPSEAQAQSAETVYGQTSFTSADTGTTASTLGGSPAGVAVDASGNVYVADLNNNRVLEFPSTCASTGCAATRVFGQASFTSRSSYTGITAATLVNPSGVAVDSSGNVYVADFYEARVVEFPSTCASTGCSATRVFGQTSFTTGYTGLTASTLNSPRSVAVDSTGNVYVVDAANSRVLQFPATCASTGCSATRVFGQSDFTSSSAGVSASTLKNPQGVAVDSGGNVYVADPFNHRVLEFPATCPSTGCSATRVYGQPSFTGASAGTTAQTLSNPTGVAVDSSGNVYVADTQNYRVLEFPSTCPATDCSASAVFGQLSFTSGTNFGPTASSVCAPVGAALDSSGNLYVADYYSRVLRGTPVGATAPGAAPTAPAPAPAPTPETTPPSSPEIAAPPTVPEPPAEPDTLTDSVRADILAAVDRGNAAWAAARQSLDPADLQAGLTGQELSDDAHQIDQLRSAGQRMNSVNISFTVLDVSLDSPNQATVHTQETWTEDVLSSSTGAILRHDPPADYSETYTVNLIDDQWIVSRIQLE